MDTRKRTSETDYHLDEYVFEFFDGLLVDEKTIVISYEMAKEIRSILDKHCDKNRDKNNILGWFYSALADYLSGIDWVR